MIFSFFASGNYVVDLKETSLGEIILLHRGYLNMINLETACRSQYGEWFHLLLPICMAVPVIPWLSQELNSQYYKMLVPRLGQRRYISIVILSLIYCSFCIVLVASFMFRACLIIVLNTFGANICFTDIYRCFFEVFLVEDLKGIIYSLMILGACLLGVVLTADVYISITIVFLINYICFDMEHSFIMCVILSVFLYFFSVKVLKRRWLNC